MPLPDQSNWKQNPRRPTSPPKLLTSGHGQLVTSFIFGVSTVSGNPRVPNLVLLEEFVQQHPQLDILHWHESIAVAAPPILPFPGSHPLLNPLTHVDAVGEQLDPAGAFEGPQSFDHCLQLHPVVGRLFLPPGSL